MTKYLISCFLLYYWQLAKVLLTLMKLLKVICARCLSVINFASACETLVYDG